MARRTELQKGVDIYISNTLIYINTVKEFMDRSSEWIKDREAEAQKWKDINERVQQYKKKLIQKKKIKKEHAKEFEDSLEETLKGLKPMQMFLDAVEMLAVTSPHVFEQNPNDLPARDDLKSVQNIILCMNASRPVLLLFKRNNEAFFEPKLENIEVMQNQLNLYITYIRRMCDSFKAIQNDLCLDNFKITLDEDLSGEDLEKMQSHINQLSKYRLNEHFRLLFLFQDKHDTFMETFRECEDRMLQFLNDLEPCAVQLDNMNKGARISSVVGSTGGLAGSILSIVGLALMPVTVGASLALVGVGAGLAAASGANSVVTTLTEARLNHNQKKKANKILEEFMEDANALQRCLNDVITHNCLKNEEEFNLKQFMLSGPCVSVSKSVDTIIDVVSAARGGQAAAKGAMAMSRALRAGLIGVNALFIGLDVGFIVKDSIALSEGSETEMSKIIRARAALWKSEVVSWQKMYQSLEKGLKQPESIQLLLRKPFYQRAQAYIF